jgi:hypothetical protein
MRNRLAIAATAVAALLAAPAALAMPVDGLTGAAYISSAVCPSGRIVASVTQNVKNAADRGNLGNVWARDNYARTILVIQSGPTSFCASVNYRYGYSTFTSIAGPSPGGTGVVSDGVTGGISASYRTTTFFGLLLATPLEPISGSFTTDYQCDDQGNCPGLVDWWTFYFSTVVGLTPNFWTYGYISSGHGNFIQNPTRAPGDITG